MFGMTDVDKPSRRGAMAEVAVLDTMSGSTVLVHAMSQAAIVAVALRPDGHAVVCAGSDKLVKRFGIE